jgi:uncharacterized cupredoxin-like copper-binding protein
MRCLFAMSAVVLAMLAGSGFTVAAQDATPAAASCVAPELPPGTPTPMEEMAPDASPAADMAGMEMASPEAIAEAEAMAEMAEHATPESAALAGSPADAAAAERVSAAAENLLACLNEGNYLGFAALLTPNYLPAEFGTSNPYDLPVFMEGVPGFEGRAVRDAQTHPDGRLSVDVTTIIGGTQVDRFRAYFVDENGTLLLDEEVPLPIENAAVEVEATMLDFAFDLSQDTVPAGELVAFTLPNEGQYPHEFAVVRLPEGISIEQVFADPSLEEQIQFIGGAYAEPGATAYLGLDNLEPGTYTAVCFVDIPEGIPHVMRGMIVEFTVE